MSTDKKSRSRQQNNRPTLLLADQICFALYSASLAMNKVYRELLKDLDLTYPQYLVMLVLWEQDGLTVTDISNKLLIDSASATLTPLLKRLESADLVKRERFRDNERQVIITLTPKGLELKKKAEAVPHDILCATACDASQLNLLKNSLISLRENLARSATQNT
jgi:DNA-binding MarR family transcriptional regulator